MTSTNILNHVDFEHLVRTHVIGPLYEQNPLTKKIEARFEVQFEALDKTKNIVFDPSSLKELNNQISERAAKFEVRDPRTRDYIKEFAERVAGGLYKSGLIALDEVTEGPVDHYKDLRS